jgi:hypothetical protein
MKKKNTYDFFSFTAVFNTDIGFATLDGSEVLEMLEIRLNLGIVELATNKMFCVKDTRIQVLGEKIKREIDVRVMGVHGDLVLCGIADQTFIVREGDRKELCDFLGRCNDFYTIILPHTQATKGYISTMKRKKKLSEMLTSQLCQGQCR